MMMDEFDETEEVGASLHLGDDDDDAEVEEEDEDEELHAAGMHVEEEDEMA